MEKVGHTTIDFQQIADRAKDFGINIDAQALRTLNRIRNDMEHHYTNAPATAIRAAISKGFPVVASLFRQIGEVPMDHLGQAWATMLQTKELYDKELQEARATLATMKWRSSSVTTELLRCMECKSELIEQTDPDNEDQDDVELRCRTCGTFLDAADMIEQVIDDVYGAEAYSRHKDAGEDGPVYSCPACDRATLLESEDECANCGEPIDYNAECGRCGEGISIQDFLDGLDGGLCSYCSWQQDKIMRED